MKKIFSIMLALILLMCLGIPAIAESGVQNGDSLVIVRPAGGPYVIVTNLALGDLDFKYGWNNAMQFENPALGYWVGVYDNTESHYLWVEAEVLSEPNPKMLKMESFDTELISGHSYTINFFIRDSYGDPVTNVSEIQLNFVAP